ncbi:DUF1648 domain-containing protein [Luteolibacter yonseiensis]|uniref:DUF1648 domain-containing protein n=1 Tax=Luteolibacter yonseiensis TaxID=1144680 RepID=A0A934VBA2_9BACT|nr:DUF1648 domain-containing protein [Luteolibacter yonseiensis]MBK1815199.1 DUF1648 domain-containing protein [Luteolibacter yonseiensis]
MKKPAIALLVLSAALLVGLGINDHQQLPERIASHFDWSGTANGWMNRTTFTATMLAVGLGIPALVIAAMHALRFIPAEYLNVPNPGYWRAPANHRKACDILAASSLWFGSAFLIWQAFFTHMIVAANRATPPALDSGKAILLTLPLLAFILGWITVLITRFHRIPTP